MRKNYLAFPRILHTVVLHFGHLPLSMRILFGVTVSLPPLISTCFLHFMHCPCGIEYHQSVEVQDPFLNIPEIYS